MVCSTSHVCLIDIRLVLTKKSHVDSNCKSSKVENLNPQAPPTQRTLIRTRGVKGVALSFIIIGRWYEIFAQVGGRKRLSVQLRTIKILWLNSKRIFLSNVAGSRRSASAITARARDLVETIFEFGVFFVRLEIISYEYFFFCKLVFL